MKKIVAGLSILLVVVAIGIATAGIYFTRVSTQVRVFRMAGQNVGPYQAGRVLLAEKINNPSSLKKGDGVLYEVDRSGEKITRVGIIFGLPGEKNLGNNNDIGLDKEHFLVGQSDDRMEMVKISQVGWKIVRQF